MPPIVFQGGVSKNIGVVKAFEKTVGHKVLVDKNSHLTGALGTAILAKSADRHRRFNFDIADMDFVTKGVECEKCANNCEIVCVYQNSQLIDAWGNKCEKGAISSK